MANVAPPRVDNRTEHLGLALPNVANNSDTDCERVAESLEAIDDWAKAGGPIRPFASIAEFPSTGDVALIYLARDTNRLYRWSEPDNGYLSVGGASSTDDIEEGAVNLFFTAARARAAVPTATSSQSGVVRVGSGLSIGADGVLSTVGSGGSGGVPAFNELVLVPTAAGQKNFAPSGGYSPGQIELLVNGLTLIGNGEDYTASDGVNIVLVTGVNPVDRLLLRRWTTSNNFPFSALKDKPTTIAGYGIEDHNWETLDGKPAALAAIAESDPLTKSVNGRSGAVTGLVEALGPIYTKATTMAAAPLGQWVSYNDGTGAGADWPTTMAIACWNVFTFGTAARKTQRATQVLDGAQQGWTFERQLHDATWSPWHRVLTDRSLIESTKGGSISTSTYVLNPAEASVHQMGVQASTTIYLPAARSAGDQVTLCAHMQGSFTVSLGGANVALPIGVTLPTMANGEMLMLIFTAKYDGTWYCAIGGKFPA